MKRPRVTLAWAQAIDGSIASAPGVRSPLSGPESLRMTHGLRARHQAILVGIGTVLVDDPSLTVRFVEGRNPRPIILDSELRTPAKARILAREDSRPLIVAANDADRGREEELRRTGAEILRMPRNPAGRLDLDLALAAMGEGGIETLMVEGGAKVLGSFLAARLADFIVVTIAPTVLGGLKVFAPEQSDGRGLPCRLENSEIETWGKDVVISGIPAWN